MLFVGGLTLIYVLFIDLLGGFVWLSASTTNFILVILKALPLALIPVYSSTFLLVLQTLHTPQLAMFQPMIMSCLVVAFVSYMGY
jgi:hypothetical protein